ncbi:hypothetical protein [Pseudonocardia sp. NPDC049635]|uniref:hypothetical protein n=1 Tax=Pseudonocardia sp. NPDC049635 TaxID=3155506 RepID=UPI0033C82E85
MWIYNDSLFGEPVEAAGFPDHVVMGADTWDRLIQKSSTFRVISLRIDTNAEPGLQGGPNDFLWHLTGGAAGAAVTTNAAGNIAVLTRTDTNEVFWTLTQELPVGQEQYLNAISAEGAVFFGPITGQPLGWQATGW